MGDKAPIKAIAVTSGKGGVGKTNMSVNLAVGLAKAGQSVVLFDADLSLANVDIALGLKPKYTIQHVISGECTLEEILVEGPAGLKIVPASSGVASLASLTKAEQLGLINAFSELSIPIDTLIVDTGAGIDSAVLTFSSACEEIVVVVCDEPTSRTDGYALIKVLSQDYGIKRFQILANMVDGDIEGRKLFEKLCSVSDRFLNVHLGYLGSVPRDEYLRKAVRAQKAVVLEYPRSEAAQALKGIADKVITTFKPQQLGGGLGFFIERLLSAQNAS